MTSAQAAASAGVLTSQAFFFGFGAGGAAFGKADADGDAAVAQIQGVRVALGAVADDGDFLCLNQGKIRGIVVVQICHLLPLVTGLRSQRIRFQNCLERLFTTRFS